MEISVFDVVINIIESFLIILFFTKYFKMKSDFKRFHFVIWIIIEWATVTWMNAYLGYEGIYVFLLPLIACFPVLLRYAVGNVFEKLYISLFVFELIAIINTSTGVLVSTLLYQKVDLEILVSEHYYLMVILTKGAFFLLSQIIAKTRREISSFMNTGTLMMFIFISFISSVVYTSIEGMLYAEEFDINMMSISLVGLLIINIFIFISFFKMQRSNEKILKDELKIQSLTYQGELNEVIFKSYKETSKLKHDLKHVLLYMELLLKNGEYERVEEELKRNLKIVDSGQKVVATRHEVIDYILNTKYNLARKKGLDMKFVLNYTQEIQISDYDLSIILGNVIDNAIENAKNGSTIIVSIEQRRSFFLLKVENEIEKEVLLENGIAKSTKKENGHGFGMSSIQEVALRNNGHANFHSEENIFICKVLFK